MATKTKERYISKDDISSALSTLDITDNLKLLIDDLTSICGPLEEPKPKAKPKSKTEKTSTKKTTKSSTTKTNKSKTTSTKTESEPTKTKTKKNEDDHDFNIGDSVYCWFGDNKLYAKVIDLLPNKGYKIEWLDFDNVKDSNFVLGSKYKYVAQTLVHSTVESELKNIE